MFPHRCASGRPRPKTAPCQATGKETFSREQSTTTSASLIEHHTRFVMLLEVPSKKRATVVTALAKHMRKLPQQLRHELTSDRGKEMADHKSFTIATNVQVYFCYHAAIGNAAATRKQTACCGSISPKEQIFRSSPRPT